MENLQFNPAKAGAEKLPPLPLRLHAEDGLAGFHVAGGEIVADEEAQILGVVAFEQADFAGEAGVLHPRFVNFLLKLCRVRVLSILLFHDGNPAINKRDADDDDDDQAQPLVDFRPNACALSVTKLGGSVRFH